MPSSKPGDLVVGPVQFNGIGDSGSELNDNVDGTRAQVLKAPLNVFNTPASTVRVTVSDPKNAVTIVYDDEGFGLLNARQYKFAVGVASVDMPGPTTCGAPADGYVQFNGGFVVREPTCATIVASIDGTEVGRGTAQLAGGPCP